MRVATVAVSLRVFCLDLMRELSADYDVVAVSSGGKDLDSIKAAGITARTVDMERRISPLCDLRALWRLYRIMREERPDMAHSITPKAGLLTMIAAKAAGVPVRVHSFTGLVFPTAKGLRKQILKSTDRLTCRCATHIHAEGQGVRHDLVGAGITSKPVEVLGHGNIRGVDLTHYTLTPELKEEGMQLRTQLSIPQEAYVFLYVGRVVTDKGISELIAAFEDINSETTPVYLLMVGNEEPQEHPLPDKLRRRILAADRIVWVNSWINDVRPYYAAADAFVLSSYREGFPNSVLEAGAMGLPSVVTDINGSREIVETDHNGIVVPPRDATALSDAMRRLINNVEDGTRMGKIAREVVEAKFDAVYVRNCVKTYYKRLLSKLAAR